MRITTYILLFIINYSLNAQEYSKCEKDFEWLSNYIENNLPAFQNEILKDKKFQYLNFKSEIKEEILKADSRNSCFKSLVNYTEYFFDNHTNLRMYSNPIDVSSLDSINKFKASNIYKTVERVNLNLDSLTKVLSNMPLSKVEGLYYSIGKAYKVAIIKDKTSNRDYVGVLLEANSKLWEPGMIKFELKETKPNHFTAFYYYRNHSMVYESKEQYDNGRFATGWYRVDNLEIENKDINITPKELFHFEKLNETTNYLYIKSFDGELRPRFDSLYTVIKPKIKALPNLIIDVRDNGGGSDANIMYLRDLMFTKDFYFGKQQIWNSIGIQKHYEVFLKEIIDNPEIYNEDTKEWVQKLIEILETNDRNQFITLSEGNNFVRFNTLNYPKKMIVIQGQKSASTTENLLLSAINSDKTITVGENSGGYFGYGNIFEQTSPSGNYSLWASTTQNDYKMKYEANGIPPKVRLPKDIDWLEESIRLLKD